MSLNPKLPNCFIAGCQKTGSTWLYHGFEEHPEIFVPKIDRLNYFTINHFRGLSWLEKWYEDVNNESAICDPTPSYFQAPGTAQRIAEFNKNSKIIITLRNPIDRAYSHYKHQFKNGNVNLGFDQTILKSTVGSFDFYRLWVQPSLYFERLNEFYQFFPKNQVLVSFYEDLDSDPAGYLRRILKFLEVDPNFLPSIVDKKVNTDEQRSGKVDLSKENFRDKIVQGELLKSAGRVVSKRIKKPKKPKVDKHLTGELRMEFIDLFREDVERLSELLQKDLDHWLK